MPQAHRTQRPSRRQVLAIATHAPLGWLAMATMATGRLADPPPDTADAEPTVIPIRRDDPDRYQNFVINWDAGTEVLCAVVRTPADYARLFHPAPVIGGKKPLAPPEAAFEKEHLLVIARVVGGDGGSSLAIERVVEKEGSLEVYGRFQPSTAQSSFSIKQAALAWIPVRELGPVTFIENDTTIATLDAGAEGWVSPPLSAQQPPPR
ncbi:MAG: hypothetical protein RLZZ326_4007 [Planctomycetota bacterium]|jgi:hypothetical protein